jgi:serine/threonine-protein kinase
MTADLRGRLQATLGAVYAVDRELVGGAMSRVFIAEERALQRRVVLKVLPPELSAVVNTDRFRREITLSAKLQHPHIVPLLSAGESDGLVYYTMPLIEGESLRARLDRSGELPIADAVRVLRDIAAALSYAHRHGIVHRDIKPDNVLLGDDGALVSDFGVAKALAADSGDQRSLTGTGVSVGTPQYMAPEQVSADPNTDHRADIYAFGVLAYEVLAGRPPFEGSSVQAVLAAHVTQDPTPLSRYRPSVPPGLTQLVMQCLEKRPADRPQSADDLLRRLERASESKTAFHRERGPARWRWIAATLGVAALIGAVSLATYRRGTEGARGGISDRSVAVLPFTNVSADPQNEYFSDGITDELITALSQLEDMRVISRASVFALKGTKHDLRLIGQRLRVPMVIVGSVQRAGQRLHVNAQLVRVVDDATIWSQSYDGDVADVFAVQESIARAIVNALQLRLARSGGIMRQPTRDLEAYEWYLKGRYAWNLRTAPTIHEAIAYFERAVARDSTFALAYTGLADAYNVLPTYESAPAREAGLRAEAFALRALAIDSSLAEAYAALGLSRQNTLQWKGAETAFQRALATNPRYATTHHWYAIFLWCFARFDEARPHVDRALALDPGSRVIALLPGIQRYYERDYDGAIADLRKVLQAYPTYGGPYQWMSLALAQQGKRDEALAALESADSLFHWSTANTRARVAFVRARTGDSAGARRDLDELSRSGTQYVSDVLIAAVYAALGDAENAFARLDRAVSANIADIKYLKIDPQFDRIRSDARYQRLLDRIGLSP